MFNFSDFSRKFWNNLNDFRAQNPVENLRKICENLVNFAVESFAQIKNFAKTVFIKMWKNARIVETFAPKTRRKSTTRISQNQSVKNRLFHIFHKAYYDDFYNLISEKIFQTSRQNPFINSNFNFLKKEEK